MSVLRPDQAEVMGHAADKVLYSAAPPQVMVLALGLHRVVTLNGATKDIFLQVNQLLGWNNAQLARVVREDRPRYEMDPGEHGCDVPMIRREGRCGNGTQSVTATIVDPATGELAARSACRRHREDLLNQAAQARADWKANGAPLPAHNTGGMLPRLAPDVLTNWESIYEWARKMPWARMPGETHRPGGARVRGEGHPAYGVRPVPTPDEPVQLSTPARPALRVIRGGAQ